MHSRLLAAPLFRPPTVRRSGHGAQLLSAVLLLSSLLAAGGCAGGSENLEALAARKPAFAPETAAARIRNFCGDCHANPKPSDFAREDWLREVKQGYYFYLTSGRKDLKPPPIHEVVEYFRSQAPEHFADPDGSPSDATERFVRAEANLSGDRGASPAISHLTWSAESRQLLYCDMRTGVIRATTPRPKKSFGARRIGSAPNAARIERVDLNADGKSDLVVSALGSFLPEDHQRGAVVWYQGGDQGYQARPLLQNVGRVCDARPGDFDGDGDLDMIVAVFGWRKTGKILLAINEGAVAGVPRFTTKVIDKRHGAIHVPPLDLNGDGRLDFIAVVSQEYETIDAYLNQGEGRFQRQRIYEANNPAYGSSGIELVDLDRDGDMDVLYTNGDSFDSTEMRPYHGLQWLENKGSFPFTHHDLGRMPGAHRALAADLDGDQDLDIVAVAMLGEETFDGRDRKRFDSVIWIEQTKPGVFVRHSLETGTCQYAAVELGDFDGDGDTDIAAGVLRIDPVTQDLPELVFWWNQGKSKERDGNR